MQRLFLCTECTIVTILDFSEILKSQIRASKWRFPPNFMVGVFFFRILSDFSRVNPLVPSIDVRRFEYKNVTATNNSIKLNIFDNINNYAVFNSNTFLKIALEIFGRIELCSLSVYVCVCACVCVYVCVCVCVSLCMCPYASLADQTKTICHIFLLFLLTELCLGHA